jgi:ABC-type multidrug transport system ATPase subunit
MITHDLDSLYALCDRVAVIADQKVVACATIPELERSDHPWIREYFLGPRGRAAKESETAAESAPPPAKKPRRPARTAPEDAPAATAGTGEA